MKENSYRFFLVSTAALFLMMLTVTATAHADSASQAKVLEGRALLFADGNLSTVGLISAKAKFSEAVELDPNDSEARLFLSITRLPALIDDTLSYTPGLPIENFREFLDRLGVDTLGRDIFNWTAKFSYDENGERILPSDVPALQEFQKYIKIGILEEVDNALSDLEYVSDTFSTTLNRLKINFASLPFFQQAMTAQQLTPSTYLPVLPIHTEVSSST